MMRTRVSKTILGVAIALTLLILLLNQWGAWDVLSGPLFQTEDEGDPSLDHVTMLKPGEATDFLPTPFTPASPPKDAIALTPGQPWERDFRASPENLTRIPPTPTIQSDTPVDLYVEPLVIPVDSKWLAMEDGYIIVLAQILDRQSHWNTADGTRPVDPHATHDQYIYTDTVIEVTEVLSGEVTSGDLLTIRQSGGQVGKDKLVVADGYPPLASGQYMLLYLTEQVNPDSPERYYTLQEQYLIDEARQMVSNPFFTKSLSAIYAEVEDAKRIEQEIREGKFTPPPPPQN
jgi:hypothetical protein